MKLGNTGGRYSILFSGSSSFGGKSVMSNLNFLAIIKLFGDNFLGQGEDAGDANPC